MLVKLAKAFTIPNEYIDNKALSILVTGPSVDVFKSVLGNVHIYENTDPFGKDIL